MKKLYPLLILAIFLICRNSSSAQMRQLSIDAADDMNEVQEFSFYSPSEGYVAYTKYIGFTTDSGRTITRKYITLSNVNFNNYPVNLTFGFGIEGVKAFNQDTIIVYGDYGMVPSILYSTDRGNSFTLVYHDRYDGFAFKSGITSMVFPQDHTIGYAVEADRILKTTNKGRTWFVVRLDVDRYYDHVLAVDNDNVFAFSTMYSTNKLFKTTNGGSTWIELMKPPGQIVYAQFLTAAKGWLIMKNDDQNGVVYYTSNGGITWEQKNDPDITPFSSSKFCFVNDSTGYGITALVNVYKTTDSGKVWQPLPRDNNFSHLNYSHNDIQVLNSNQLWAGGGHGFIEINTNSSDNPLPVAFFKIDTNGVEATGTINLRNYSKPIYQYKWFKNDTLISTSYHTSFTHSIYQFRDTIKLVVSDGTHSDTLVKYIGYPKVWITSFTPTSAAQGDVVTINGYNFSGAFHVRFGGVPASSFTVISNTQIQAVVGAGSSGNVEVITVQNGSAIKDGFTYLGVPNVDLPSAISDSILCKAESVTVTIQNSEPGVLYQLMSWGFGATVSGSAMGNGGTISFVTSPISESGQYRVRANRIGDPVGYGFKTYFNIKVEHTRARFVADQVNITPGETVTYAAQAGEARDYLWTFYQDASTATATGVKAPGISYAGSGQKTLQLISISENGCRDTVNANAVFVYTSPVTDASCFINPMDSTGATGMAVSQVMNSYDDGTYVIGSTASAPKLRSMIGVAKEFATGNHSFFAKYNVGGVLKWVHYFKPGAGAFAAGQTDAQGNIYLTGYAVSTQWLYFGDGDSMQFYAAPVDTTYLGARTNGFVLKLDRNGKYIWHTILYDHIKLWQGFAANAKGERITIKDNHIIVVGGFFSTLSYARNGVIQQLYDIPSGVREHENHAVLKIRPDGTLMWNAVLRFQATNWHRLSDVSVDKSGNSYLVGTYENYLGVYDVSGVERVKLQGQTAYHRAFMVKYDAAGAVQWHNNFVSSYQYGDARLTKVVADDDGNTYVAGEMFNWGMPVTINITHSDGTVAKDSVAAFALYKFDTNGKRRWGVGSRYPYYGGTTALYARGNEVYAAGQLYNNGVPLSSFQLTSSDGNNRTLVINQGECYVAKYDTAGVFKRVYTSGYNYLGALVSPTSLYINSKDQVILGANARKSVGGDVHDIFGITWPNSFQHLTDGFFVKMQADFCKAALTANAGPDKIGCVNDTVSIGARESGDYYSWTSNPAGFTSNLPNPVPRPLVNTTYYLKVTNEEGEIAYDTVTVSLKPAPYVNAGRDTAVCSAQGAALGTPAIAGNTYQWYLLSTNSPFGSGTAQVYVYPNFTTSYVLRAIGANGCPAYDTITVTTLYAPDVRIESPATTICKGEPVVFTAVAQNVGPAPVYQWKVRGVKVGTNSSTYTTDSLKHGDRISVEVTHNNICLSQPTVSTSTGALTVKDTLDAVVAVTGNNVVTEGDLTVISANVSNVPGYQLKWQDSTSTHNWQDLPAQASVSTYAYKPLTTGDKIRCVLTFSNSCATVKVVNSPGLSFTVNKITGIDPVPAAQYGLRYYPNPVQRALIIDSLRLSDRWQQLQITGIDGKQTFLRMDINNRTRVEIAAEGLRQGMYVAILRNRSGVAVYLKFIKL
ncbi:hypothetical protein FAM09_18980 [Niastella caeni]|uniref:IPT/TIG domain-containing protein n=1 Tax=Niastella caeni TaxID=2569763 RepID=A0A4S8HNS3_9BACT|nr:IPT/TIG domain-containing protein [Niastella caeni]THU37040.1 hypothetical protein FAM09_18980 [Niastella caeni]